MNVREIFEGGGDGRLYNLTISSKWRGTLSPTIEAETSMPQESLKINAGCKKIIQRSAKLWFVQWKMLENSRADNEIPESILPASPHWRQIEYT